MFSGLLLSAFLQFGLLNGGAVVMVKPDFLYQYSRTNEVIDVQKFPPAYGVFGVNGQGEFMYFETSVRTDMWMLEPTNWQPFDVAFSIGGGIKLGLL